MELQRIGVKVFMDKSAAVEAREFVPLFHRLIQTHALKDHLLVDVADYTHVPEGPGAVLVAHEANFSMDQADDRLGLLYQRKQPLEGDFGERLRVIFRAALLACQLLEEEPEVKGRVRFRGEEVLLIANDRLLVPNTQESFETIHPLISEFLRGLYQGAECEVARYTTDPNERLILTAKSLQRFSIKTLLDCLAP